MQESPRYVWGTLSVLPVVALKTDVPSPCTLLVHPASFWGVHVSGIPNLLQQMDTKLNFQPSSFLTGLKISSYYPKNISRDYQGEDIPDTSLRLIIMSLWKCNPENCVPLSAPPITGRCFPSPCSPMSSRAAVLVRVVFSMTTCFPWGLFSWQS